MARKFESLTNDYLKSPNVSILQTAIYKSGGSKMKQMVITSSPNTRQHFTGNDNVKEWSYFIVFDVSSLINLCFHYWV